MQRWKLKLIQRFFFWKPEMLQKNCKNLGDCSSFGPKSIQVLTEKKKINVANIISI